VSHHLHDTPGRIDDASRVGACVRARALAGRAGRAWGALLAIATLAMVSGGGALAQPVIDEEAPPGVPGVESGAISNVPARLEELVVMLDSPDLTLRDISTAALNDDPRVSLEVIEGLLDQNKDAALTPEQRVRLESVGIRKFVARPRGAMGVQFQQFDLEGEGVVIQMTVGNFESTRVLMPGDVLLTIAGTPINSVDDARAAIISHEPGERVELRIERRGEPMAVSLRLGSFAELQRGANLDLPTMVRAWGIRRARSSDVKASEPVTPRISARRFDRLVSLDRVATEMREMNREEQMVHERTDPMSAVPPGPPTVESGGAMRGFRPVPPFVLDSMRQPSGEAVALNQKIRTIEQRLAANRRKLDRANIANRGEIQRDINLDEMMLNQLRNQQLRQRGGFQP
jgi:hypothetical protein